MRNIVLAAVAVSFVAATPAVAATSGFHFGAGATHDNVATGGDLEGVGVNGIGGTVFAGYDLPLSDNTFVGVEANFDLASAKVGDSGLGLEIDHSFGATARAGINLNSSTALYGRVGYQRGKMTWVIDADEYSYSRDGLRFGAGVETTVADKLSLRVEYNHTHYYFNDEDKLAWGSENGGVNNNQFVVAVSYGF